MVVILANNKLNRLEISNYNGNSGETFSSEVLSTAFPINLNFYREGNNNSYSKGKIVYQGECENTLVVSPYANNFLKDVRDAFIFLEDSFVEISPIHNIISVIERIKSHLSGKNIVYNVPYSISTRENLKRKDSKSLEIILRNSYGISPKEVIPIQSKSSCYGIFYVVDKSGNNYVFKYKNKNRNRAETLSEIAEIIPDFFPRNYKRLDTLGYTLNMGDGWYGLESFVNGETKERDLDYFSVLGENIGLLHLDFRNFLMNNPKTEKIFSSSYNFFSESNIASLYLDLLVNFPDKFLLSELEEMIYGTFSSRMRGLQRALIHRDLNQSNVLWAGKKPKIIDSETIGFFQRIYEFIPALILQGNRNKPNYIKGSLYEMVNNYNRHNNISNEEIRILPDLLRYSFVRYFIVRNIRRNFGEKAELEELKKDLDKIKQETP